MAPPLLSSSQVLIAFIRIYQRLISPLFGPRCRFMPTCSSYGIEAMRKFGMIKGGWLTVKRVLKCHPLHLGWDDPVHSRVYLKPENTNDGFETQSSSHRVVVPIFHDLASMGAEKKSSFSVAQHADHDK